LSQLPGLLSYLQAEVDERAEPGRFVLTGSHNFALLQRVAESLAGRTAVLHLLDVPGCIATGATREAVEQFIREAIASHLDGGHDAPGARGEGSRQEHVIGRIVADGPGERRSIDNPHRERRILDTAGVVKTHGQVRAHTSPESLALTAADG
jgi:hypothetical protein